ncbi:MAG: LysM peptidoglycan-binding domain-containing protein [Clostridiales Family XIII bacterium]|jgi:hypothetical protein|nr:LysM peptidoglycan-binding domain-containing protein [Clostridiales Family XIII bacterium]
MDYIQANDVQTRIRRRRRRLAGTRRERTSIRMRRAAIIVSACVMTALAGYIGAQDGGILDTGLSYTAQAAEETLCKNITVQSGDTIWSIASAYAEPSTDIRKSIKEICALNGIEPGKIYPGQTIKVPIPAHLAQ